MGTSLDKKKQARKQIIYDLIKKNNNLLSRNDLCKKSSYSMTIISEAVEELLREKRILETESAEQRVGRPPVLLSINPHAAYFIGIECSSYSINVEAIDSLDESVYTNNLYLSHPTADDLLEGIRTILSAIHTYHPEIWMHTPFITLSLPGKLDTQNGIGISYSSIPDWKMVDVKAYLQKHFDKPFLFMNNIDSMLIGYRFLKHVPDDDSTLFIMIRNGTGIRYFANHSLLSNYGIVCEFGHAKAPDSNRICICGKRGCYDAEISNTAIINKIKEYAVFHDNELNQRLKPLESSHEIILEFLQLVREKNPYALEVFNNCSFQIACLLTEVLLVSSADTIVLSTEMCHIMPLFKENILRHLTQNKVSPLPHIDFVLPQNSFGSLGAALSGYHMAPENNIPLY